MIPTLTSFFIGFGTVPAVVLVAILAAFIFWLSIKPSNDRDWSPDQAVLPYAEFGANQKDQKGLFGQSGKNFVTIHNIRHLRYRSEFEYEPRLYDKTFDMAKLKTVDYVVTHFASWDGPAHVFLSFGFENLEYVAVSIEIRKKKGQKFSPWLGLVKQFELMYVIADERDVIQLRTHHRKHPVYIYPLDPRKVTPEKARIIFLDMLKRVNKLHAKPEFYNTLYNSCGNNLAAHLNRAFTGAIPWWSYKVVLPGYFIDLLQEAGLIDMESADTVNGADTVSTAAAKQNFNINEKSLRYSGDDEGFSRGIRGV